MSEGITSQPHDHPHTGITEHASGHGHGSDHGSTAATPFSAAEEEALRKSDVQAGTYIVCLISGIFSIGVVLYTIVFLSVWL
jgi:hypothetical protein